MTIDASASVFSARLAAFFSRSVYGEWWCARRIVTSTAVLLDAFHQVAVPAGIVCQCAAVATLGERAVDVAGVLLDRGVVCLLGDQHRRPWVPFARGDDELQGLLVEGAAVLGEALAESCAPLILGNS